MHVQFLDRLVVVHPDGAVLLVQGGESGHILHRAPVGAYDPEAVAEDARGDELRLGRKAGLFVKGEEPGVLRGIEIDGLAVESGRGLGCPPAFPSFRMLLLFVHACCH